MNILRSFATLGSIGYFPASGTLASLLIWIIFFITQPYVLLSFPLLLGLIVVSFFIIRYATFFFRQKDPSAIVLDECIGMLIALYGLPYSSKWQFLAFLLFRFFDISKLAGISYCERYRGALGILLDDIVAGIYANLIVRLLLSIL